MAQYQEGQRLQGSDGKVYVVQGGVPREAQSAPQSGPPAFIPGTPKPAAQPTPFQVEDQQMQRRQMQLSEEAAARAAAKSDGGKPLSEGTSKRIETGVGGYSALAGSEAAFQDDFSGNTITGGLENTLQGLNSSIGTEGQRNWWANFKTLDNQIRNDLFGATLTPSEQKAYSDTTVSPSLDPKIVRENMAARTGILKKALDRQRRFMIANGYNEEAVAVLYEPLMAMESLAEEAAPKNNVPSFAPGQPQMGANTSGSRNEDDPALAGLVQGYAQLLEKSPEPGAVIQWLRSKGVTDPEVLRTAASQAVYRKKNPNVPLDQYDYSKVDDRVVPLSGFSQTINDVVGNDPSGVGGYLVGAGQFLTGNTLDNMSSNPEQARASMDVMRTQSPTATAIGEVSGGIMGALSGEAGLARLGMSGGFARGALADTAMGAANGAGAADDGNRFAGAALGGGAALAGSVAGNALAKTAGRVVSPSGGGMNDLYKAGVRPTLGQRVANANGGKGLRGMAGRAVNATEEAMQSVPLVGSAIRGSRQEARDQFQVGAFNEALKEVGEQLPKGVGPGTIAQGYTQKTFDRVYAEARKGMQFVGDQDFTDEIKALADEIGSLGPQNTGRLKAILKNRVANKIDNTGQANGDAYKRMVSGLDEQIRTIGKDPQAAELTGILTKVKAAVEASARRHSPKESAELLDAADAGYAKFVRIEEAARRRGGDAGTFSPAQFDSAVQNTSGGVRSKAYLRGDALMQDYAQAGRGLDDKLPNSGTADRVMAGYAVGAPAAGGAIFLSPQVAAVLGAIGVAYAPGVRKVVKGAMAPGGPKSQAIRVQLEKRARSIGRGGAAIGAAVSQGTAPSQ